VVFIAQRVLHRCTNHNDKDIESKGATEIAGVDIEGVAKQQ